MATAALHRSTAANRGEVFEYSARAASVPQAETHAYFQRVEQRVPFQLPGDTPAGEKLKLDAENCLWRRLCYFPDAGGSSLAAQSCYRTTDTRGRPGSYFVHALLGPAAPADGAISALECLKLSGSPFWVPADDPDFPFDIPSIESLTSLPGFGVCVNDDLLREFLTAPPTDEVSGPVDSQGQPAIPLRWHRVKVEDRRQLVSDLLHALMDLDPSRNERVVIACEPSIAALAFYGVFRFLPVGEFTSKISFSTYESHTGALPATLNACSFFSPGTDLTPEVYRGRGFAWNTFGRGGIRKFRNPDRRFPGWIVSQFVNSAEEGFENLMADLNAVGFQTLEEWDQAAVLDSKLAPLTRVGEPLKFQDTGAVRVFAGRRLAREIAGQAVPPVAKWSNDQFLEVIDRVGIDPKFEPGKLATRVLMKNMPPDAGVWRRFLGLSKLSPFYKGLWLASYINIKGALPGKLSITWDASSLEKGGPVWHAIAQIKDPARIPSFARAIPRPMLPQFLQLVQSVAATQRRPELLTHCLEFLDVDSIGIIFNLRKETEPLRKSIEAISPPSEQRLTPIFRKLADEIWSDPARFDDRFDSLYAGQNYLDDTSKRRLQSAQTLRTALREVAAIPGLLAPPLSVELSPVGLAAIDKLLDVCRRVFGGEGEQAPASAYSLSLIRSSLNRHTAGQGEVAWESLRHWLMPRQADRLLASGDKPLVALLVRDGAADWVKQYPAKIPPLRDWAIRTVQKLHEQLDDIADRVKALHACRLVVPELAVKIEAWQALVKQFELLRQPIHLDALHAFATRRKPLPEATGLCLRDVAPKMAGALDGEVWVDHRKNEIKNWNIVCTIGIGLLNQELLHNIPLFERQLRDCLPKR